MLENQQVVYELEANLLGCLLKDHSLIDELILTEQHFESARNREWFKIIMDFHKADRTVDYVTVKTLEADKLDSIGGVLYMTEMVNSVPSVHAFPTYQQSIMDYHNISKAKDIATDFLFNISQFARKEELQSFMENVSRLETSTVINKENFRSKVAKRLSEHADAPVEGFSGVDTGFESLNRLTDGWKAKDLVVLGASLS